MARRLQAVAVGLSAQQGNLGSSSTYSIELIDDEAANTSALASASTPAPRMFPVVSVPVVAATGPASTVAPAWRRSPQLGGVSGPSGLPVPPMTLEERMKAVTSNTSKGGNGSRGVSPSLTGSKASEGWS